MDDATVHSPYKTPGTQFPALISGFIGVRKGRVVSFSSKGHASLPARRIFANPMGFYKKGLSPDDR